MSGKVTQVTFYRDKDPLGHVSLVDGIAVIDEPKLAAMLSETNVIDFKTREPVKPEDGERYLEALIKNFRPPYFFCRASQPA